MSFHRVVFKGPSMNNVLAQAIDALCVCLVEQMLKST